jgi:hypothetical protein
MKIVLAAAALATLIGSEASAVTLNFDVATETGGRFIFSLPENPVPDDVLSSFGEPGLGAIFFRIPVRDAANNSRLLQVSFANEPGFLAMRITLPSENIFLGERLMAFRDLTSAEPQLLFTGTITNPTFKRGTFQYASFAGDQQFLPLDGGTIRISAIAAAVPEPVTWLSMVGGFALAGGALRYRRRNAAHALRAPAAAITG